MAETIPTPPEGQEPQKSKRDLFKERLSSKYADKSFDDDEALYGQAMEDYDGYEKELNDYRDSEGKLNELMAADPRSARFLHTWMKDGDPLAALVREYGDDFMEQLQDPEKQEELAQASKDFAERMAKNKEYEEQYQANMQQTLADIEAVQQEDGLADDDMDEAMTFLIGVMKDGLLGKFSPESIRMAISAVHHDSDVEEAAAEGEVRGRNANIKEKLRKPKRGDGMPNMGGKNQQSSQPKERRSIFAMAEDAL